MPKIIPELSIEVKRKERLEIGKRATELMRAGVTRQMLMQRFGHSDSYIQRAVKEYAELENNKNEQKMQEYLMQ